MFYLHFIFMHSFSSRKKCQLTPFIISLSVNISTLHSFVLAEIGNAGNDDKRTQNTRMIWNNIIQPCCKNSKWRLTYLAITLC